jgi:hypothetical protein
MGPLQGTLVCRGTPIENQNKLKMKKEEKNVKLEFRDKAKI